MSHEAQLAAVRELAARHGDADPMILSDWSRSGRQTRNRPQYAELLRMIEAGQVSAVYSYSLSRLSRSLRDFASLVELAQAHGVPVRLAKDTMNLGTASGRLNVNVLASVSAFEAEVAQERAQDTITARRARGDHVGSAPYGFILRGGKLEVDPDRPIEPVVAAYREGGGYSPAAKLLNERGVIPARGTQWSGMAVRRVVNRVMPETCSVDGRPGRKERRDFLLSGLLRCPCGTTLTGRMNGHHRTYGQGEYSYVSYQCWRGRYDHAHSRPYMVGETGMLPWVKAEAERLRVPAVVAVDGNDERRADLEARRARIVESFIDGLIDKAERDRRLVAIADELDRLEAVSGIVAVPSIDWTWAPVEINRVLRALWRSVTLGPDLRPVSADWAVPEWRA